MQKKNLARRIFDHDNFVGYIFILPFLIGFLCLTLIPMAVSFYVSFTKYDIISTPIWIGLDNYKRMFFGDPRYIISVKVTLFYVFVSVPLKILFALLVAFMLNEKARVFNFYRSIYYIPSLIGGSIAVSMMWKELFSVNGVINSMLGALGLPDTISWLSNPDTAIWSLILLTVWQFGSSMIIFAAGLKQIPESYYEAAKIDSASTFQCFVYITLPSLSPIIFFNLVMQLISGFMAFTQSFVITKGGPLDSTLLYALYIYQRAFSYQDMGYGSAMSWTLLVIIGLATALVFKSSSYWVYYESKEEK